MLAVLVCGVSFGEEAKVETNDQKLLALCEDPEATAEAIEALLKAGADVNVRTEYNVQVVRSRLTCRKLQHKMMPCAA